MAHKEMFTAWLKDAYGMEQALIPVLENHAKDAKNMPEMQQKIQQHIEQTRQHADLDKQILERYDEKPSAVKTAIGSMFGAMQSVSTGPFADEAVKNCLSDFAAENFEIAAYTALIAAAEKLGDQQAVSTFERIMRDEQDMADFIDEHLPSTVQMIMQVKAAQHTS